MQRLEGRVTVAIDPGLKAGVTVWEDGELIAAWLSCGRGWLRVAQQIVDDLLERFTECSLKNVELAIEIPLVRDDSPNPNALIKLTLCIGAVIGKLHQLFPKLVTTTYLPSEWKGGVPKNIMVERIQQKLSAKETKRVDLPAKSYQHNVWDAVGIGLHHEKKTRRGKK